jgi:hypothetical protein
LSSLSVPRNGLNSRVSVRSLSVSTTNYLINSI